MKRNWLRPLFYIVLASSFLACAAALVWHLQGKQSDLAAQAMLSESPPSPEAPPLPAKMAIPSPRLAPALLTEPQKNDAVEPQSERMQRERFFTEERRIMAKAWKLTENQASQFEAAVRDAARERGDVVARMTLDNISPAEVAKELDAVIERHEGRLREVLGPDLTLQYKYTAGMFVAGGFDKKPFIPPVVDDTGQGGPT